MKDWINHVGRCVPVAITLGNKRIYYGRECYNDWYGMHAADGRLMHKLRMVTRNGKGI